MTNSWNRGGAILWSSGPWSLEVRDDEFADISHHGRVILRSVRAVVRDRNWDTAALVVDRVAGSDSTVTLHVRTVGLGAELSGIVRAEMRGDRLRMFTDLESASEFWTNRTGLVVLHPPALAGAPLRIAHSDGEIEQTRFPESISPHQPAFDIVRLGWRHGDTDVNLRFDGDVFEMEDQRNWTDASYKTYSRPLSLPFPYRLTEGERVVQTVELEVTASAAGGQPSSVDAESSSIALRPGGRFPSIALGASTAPDPGPVFPPIGDEVLVELDLASTNWRAALHRSRAGGLPLDVRFLLDPAGRVTLLEGVAELKGLEAIRIGAYHQVGDARHVSDADAVDALREALTHHGLAIPVVGGSRSHFTELNRERDRVPDELDGLTVTVTPLFHASGTEQLVESVAMQRLVARQTSQLAGGRPVHVGPVCLRPRFNDVATASQPSPRTADLAEGYGAEYTGSVDERQSAPELAAWTVASAAALSVPGVASLAWFEEWGPRGIRTAAGDPLPVAVAIDALAALSASGGELLWGDSPDGTLWALGVRTAEGTTVLAANIGRQAREVTIDIPDGAVTVTLDAGVFVELNRP